MDAATERLIERTRQRRELLNQKMGKTPEAAPRKRRTPLSEDLTSVNTVEEPDQQNADDSPKRQRVRDNEQEVKPDTPAISSVQSRLQSLVNQSGPWSQSHTDGVAHRERQDPSTPVPVPRKSLSSPPLERRQGRQENVRPVSPRKSKLAELARSIDSWEYDASRPSIVKEEEKRPRWQPPKSATTSFPAAISSPKKTRAPLPPTTTPTVNAPPTSMVTGRSLVSSPSVKASLAHQSPARSGSRVGFNSTPRPFQPYCERAALPTPVKSPAASSTRVQQDDTPSRPFSFRSQDTPKTAPKPVSGCKAASVGRPGLSTATPVSGTLREICGAAKPPIMPADSDTDTVGMRSKPPIIPAHPDTDTVHMRTKPRQSMDDEPTAHPVTARMSAWEQISSAQTVGDVKKVKPGSATPSKTPCPSQPAFSRSPLRASARDTNTSTPGPSVFGRSPLRASARASNANTPGPSQSGFGRSPLRTSTRVTPSKTPSVTPSKSFKDSILERAAQVNPVTAGQAVIGGTSPQKSVSPKKASSAMKAVQEQLMQQTHSTSMAERLRQERMLELQTIQDRWKNGILNEEGTEQTPDPVCDRQTRQQEGRDKARADFDSKLASVGLGLSAQDKRAPTPGSATPNTATATRSVVNTTTNNTTTTITNNNNNKNHPPKAPPLPPECVTKAAPKAPPVPPSPSPCSKAGGKQPTSLFQLVSQKKKASTDAQSPGKGGRKVKFEDSFDSDDTETCRPKKPSFEDLGHGDITDTASQPQGHPHDDADMASQPQGYPHDDADMASQPQGYPHDDDLSQSDTTEDSPTDTDSEVVLRRPRPGAGLPTRKTVVDDDDLSLSAFVPASVRRQSILPSPQRHTNHQADSGSEREANSDSSSSLSSHSSTDGGDDGLGARRCGYTPEDTEESVDERDAIGDLLDQAMDSDSGSDTQTSSASQRTPAPVMRKRSSHRRATEDGQLPFSVDSYRASRNLQVLEVKQSIVRNSQYCGTSVKEQPVEMPTHPPTPAPRQSIHERVRELQELVQQEQSIIVQTSNALNQCCSSNFAGSSQQVECNRILLLACQKRQGYMAEIQRLRDTKILDPSGPGPKGSLTITDIRLPLKKDFVTKIGTAHDTTTYFFMVLVRNGTQLLFTQMLSTHEPMMRGSLDFPNIIKVNGITGAFTLSLDIYSMSVSRETVGKGKKKKTPKKNASQSGDSMTGTVRTTSFSQVTSVPLSMKSLDKHSFHLDRLSHLSPLHGMIYLNLKCLMEASVEERGFLTMFEDVSGFGSWHRRWCALSGNKLQYWKYPDDEARKDPIGYIDLKRCVTSKAGLISRDVCARPHTFELVTVRQPRRGEKDTLVSRTYNTMTTVRHQLSADTKEERIVWCNKVNQALATLRTWNPDAMRPITH